MHSHRTPAIPSRSQIIYMDVGPEPDVVSEVPAFMVRVFVDNDVVAVPEPVVAEADVVGGDAEVEAAEPEAIGATAAEMPDVATAEAAGEAAVFPGVVEMVMGVVATRVMADPLAVRVDVRRVGMSRLVVEVRIFRRGMRSLNRTWTMRGDMCRPTSDATEMLGEGDEGDEGKQAAYR